MLSSMYGVTTRCKHQPWLCRSVFYLLKVKGVANAAQAAFMVSGLEIGGLAGSLLAGRLADSMVNNAKDPVKEGNVGKRVQVCASHDLGVLDGFVPHRYRRDIGHRSAVVCSGRRGLLHVLMK
jgi:hypothetical protein